MYLASRSVPKSSKRMQILQQWHGRVTLISSVGFLARLIDLTSGDDKESSEVEFFWHHLSPENRQSLCLGTTFKWLIGYKTNDGTTRRFSEIKLDRPGCWKGGDFKNADACADKLSQGIKWD